jgi:lysophospholipase L1-like esterase
VLCLGDSCTYGFGLAARDAWPQRADALLEARVLNAGVPGFSSWQGIRRYRALLRQLEPAALVVQFGNNDAAPWPSARVPGTREVTGCLTDAERKLHLEALALSDTSRVLGSVAAWFAPTPDATHFGPDEFNVARERVPLTEFRENLEAFAGEGLPIVFVVWPRRANVEPGSSDPIDAEKSSAYLDCICEMEGPDVRVVDLRTLFRSGCADAPNFYTDEVHASAAGSKIVARAVSRALASLGFARGVEGVVR